MMARQQDRNLWRKESHVDARAVEGGTAIQSYIAIP